MRHIIYYTLWPVKYGILKVDHSLLLGPLRIAEKQPM